MFYSKEIDDNIFQILESVSFEFLNYAKIFSPSLWHRVSGRIFSISVTHDTVQHAISHLCYLDRFPIDYISSEDCTAIWCTSLENKLDILQYLTPTFFFSQELDVHGSLDHNLGEITTVIFLENNTSS